MASRETALTSTADSDVAVQAYIEDLLCESQDNGDKDVGVNLSLKAESNDLFAETPLDNAESSPFLRQLALAQRRGRPRAKGPVSASEVDSRPLWARSDFSCLSFKVSGLRLAVPLHFIDGMQPLDLAPIKSLAEPTAQGYQASILGRMQFNREDRDVLLGTVIDTAKLVMPERYDIGMIESYRYVLILKNCDWAIAVDAVGGEILLKPKDVRWRSEHTRREWLAGTVVDKMCALIDIDVLNRQMMADDILKGAD